MSISWVCAAYTSEVTCFFVVHYMLFIWRRQRRPSGGKIKMPFFNRVFRSARLGRTSAISYLDSSTTSPVRHAHRAVRWFQSEIQLVAPLLRSMRHTLPASRRRLSTAAAAHNQKCLYIHGWWWIAVVVVGVYWVWSRVSARRVPQAKWHWLVRTVQCIQRDSE